MRNHKFILSMLSLFLRRVTLMIDTRGMIMNELTSEMRLKIRPTLLLKVRKNITSVAKTN